MGIACFPKRPSFFATLVSQKPARRHPDASGIFPSRRASLLTDPPVQPTPALIAVSTRSMAVCLRARISFLAMHAGPRRRFPTSPHALPIGIRLSTSRNTTLRDSISRISPRRAVLDRLPPRTRARLDGVARHRPSSCTSMPLPCIASCVFSLSGAGTKPLALTRPNKRGADKPGDHLSRLALVHHRCGLGSWPIPQSFAGKSDRRARYAWPLSYLSRTVDIVCSVPPLSY